MQLSPADLAHKYFVDDLPGAKTPGARLQGILESIDSGQVPSAHGLAFLAERGLLSLHDLATGVLTQDAFRGQSLIEKDARVAKAREQAAAKAAESERQTAERDATIKARFEAMKNEPVGRRREAKQLRARYGLGFIEPDIYRRVMKLLKQVADGRRLSPKDVIWLSTEAEDCWTPELRSAHHRLEAAALTREWEQTGDPWTAVNACAHWRKGEKPQEALKLTATVLALPDLAPKCLSALRTTRGGAMRDLGRLAEACELGHEAQRLRPNDFRPCTLLGAVYMQQGDFSTGDDWFQKAEALGAERHAVDQDLRGVLDRCAPDVRDALCAFLLSRDATRFAWVQKRTPRQER